MQALDHARLLGGLDLRHHLVEPKRVRHRVGGRAAVAGQHDDAEPVVMEDVDGLAARGLHRVGDAEGARLTIMTSDRWNLSPTVASTSLVAQVGAWLSE